MEEPTVVYKPLSPFYALVAVLAIVEVIVGYCIGIFLPPTDPIDILAWLVWYLTLPVGVSLLGVYIGWFAKKSAVAYNAPEWELKPVQYEVEGFRRYVREYHKRYVRLEARSNYWYFQLPILIMILLCALPFYVLEYNPALAEFIPIILSSSLLSIHLISVFGAFLSTQNDGSVDFTLPLVREAIWLAKEQSKVPGISEVRVVVDKGVTGNLETVSNPRVVVRIEGIENEGYIESWSEDLRAINRILCRLNPSEDYGQVVWWWLSRERLFRKYTDSENNGYFVKFPIPFLGKELGVRDVKILTVNAAAIMLLEIIKRGREEDHSRQILVQLGASPQDIESAQNARH